MMEEPSQAPWQRFSSLASIVLIVATLYVAQDLILPFALAALVTFLLAPIVTALQRLRLPRVVAVVTSVFIALGAVVALAVTLASQLDELSASLPQYRETIQHKLSALGGTVADLEKDLSEAVPSLVDAATPGGDGATAAVAKPAPVPVTIADKPGFFEQVGAIAGPVLGPLGNIAVVFVLVLFMLMYMEDLRDRMVSVINRRGVTMTTQAMTDVTRRISRYLLMTLVINTLYGVPVGIGLLVLGVPNALLWGLLAVILRFIPYLGPCFAAGFPIVLSFAISPDWSLTIQVSVMFLVLELISNNVIEPWIYGSRTGLSPLAVIVSALFWTWLWGITGLLLAVPLTLIVVVSGRYVPSLRFLHTLLGDEPGLGASERFYQRLVAGNSDEAERVLAEVLEKRPLPALYDAMIVPALRAAKHDEATGRLDTEAAARLRALTADLVAALPALAEKKRAAREKYLKAEADKATASGLAKVEAAAALPPPLTTTTTTTSPPSPTTAPPTPGAPGNDQVRVVFVPAGDPTGALVGPLLADLLQPHGITPVLLPVATLTSELALAALAEEPDVVVVAGLPPAQLVRMRHLVSKLAAERRDTRLVAGLWDAPVEERIVGAPLPPRRRIGFGPFAQRDRGPTVLADVRTRAEGARGGASADEALLEAGAHQVVHTLAEAADTIVRAAQHVRIRRAA